MERLRRLGLTELSNYTKLLEEAYIYDGFTNGLTYQLVEKLVHASKYDKGVLSIWCEDTYTLSAKDYLITFTYDYETKILVDIVNRDTQKIREYTFPTSSDTKVDDMVDLIITYTKGLLPIENHDILFTDIAKEAKK